MDAMLRMPDIHVTPVDDLLEHDTSRFCWCGPRVEQNPEWDAALVVHQAMDGRELVEQHGLQ